MSLAFDSTYYQGARPDVFDAFVQTQGSTGLTWAQFAENHFNTFGWLEGSNPNANFVTSDYLQTNVDVAAAGVNPFTHFLQFGSLEGRVPYTGFPLSSLDTAAYATANPDLAAAGITTEAQLQQHFMIYGQFESRPATPTVTPPTQPGTSQVLTTALDNLTGTAADDTFVGSIGAAGVGTYNTGDVIDGGAGTDTLTVSGSAAAASVFIPTLSNVEVLQVTATNANDTHDLVNSSGITTIRSLGSTGTPTFNNVGAIAGVELSSTSGGGAGIDVNYQASVVAGTSDTQNVALSSNGTSGTAIGNLDFDGIETIAVTATGANFVGSLTGNASTTSVTVAGDGSLQVNTALANSIATIDASSNTGGVNFGAGTNSLTFTGGTGNDTINMAGNLEVNDTLNGGDGTDTLRVLNQASLTSTALGRASNFEALQVDTATTVTLDVDDIAGVTSFIFGTTTAGTNGITAGNTVTIDDAVTGSTVSQWATNGGALVFDLKTDGSADELTVNLIANNNGGGVNTFAALSSLTADDPETLTINTSDNSANGADGSDIMTVAAITLSDTTTLNITGSEDLRLGGTSSAATNLATIAGDTYTGDLDLGAVGTAFAISSTGATISTGSGDDIVSLNVGAAGVLGATALGANTTVQTGASATQGDLLALSSAAGTGLSIIDLTSATDQISQLLGSANAAAQTGLEHIDVSGFAAAGANTSITGTSGVNAITGGAGVDTINAGAGADVIDGNGGADNITLGGGVDTFNFAAGDSVASTAQTFAGANLAANDTITFGNSLDIIQDFAAGASGDLFNGANAGAPTTGIGVAVAAGFAAGTTYFVSGNFNTGTGVFTATADGAGADTLIVEGAAATALGASTNAVMLIGVDSDDLVAANFI